jgi:hypothetical protein
MIQVIRFLLWHKNCIFLQPTKDIILKLHQKSELYLVVEDYHLEHDAV